jgi:hypothetical protein
MKCIPIETEIELFREEREILLTETDSVELVFFISKDSLTLILFIFFYLLVALLILEVLKESIQIIEVD